MEIKSEKTQGVSGRDSRETGIGEIIKRRDEIRRNALKARNAMSREERRKGSLLMTERILGHQWFYRSDIILCFASFGSEIDTFELIEEGICKGKRIFLPKVTNASGKWEMCFGRLLDRSELSAGYKGILEPPESAEKYVYFETDAERTLMLMPGVAFDPYRNRLGYGKGFYDRFLAKKDALQLHTIAVGFQCQLVDRIPEIEGDIRPYQIICT